MCTGLWANFNIVFGIRLFVEQLECQHDLHGTSDNNPTTVAAAKISSN